MPAILPRILQTQSAWQSVVELPWAALRSSPGLQRDASTEAMRDIGEEMQQSWERAPPQPISPGGGGAHNWSPMSFNPNTGLTYIPTSTANSFTYASEPKFDPKPGQTTGTLRPAPMPTRDPPPAIGPPPLEGTGARGALVAWDPVAQHMAWRVPGGGGIGGGTVTTAGNLVFQTINDGRLLAYSADKGEKLLEIQTGLRSGMGPPITWQAGGKQYVSLMGGVGTPSANNAGPGNVATPNSPKLLTFVLDGTATLE